MINVSRQTYSGGLRQARHSHDTMSVTMVLAGSLRERVGSLDEHARPLSLVIKPVDVEHENQFGDAGVRTLQLVFDADEAAELGRAHQSLQRWHWIHDGAPVREFFALARALRAGDTHAVELAAIDALGAIDALPRGRAVPPIAMRVVRQRLDDERRPPRVRDLANEAGMHPVYLARLFRRSFGCTIGHYVRRKRVRDVVALLRSPMTSLSTVAHEAGFADHAHMCRAFRAEVGLPPSEYRAILAG